MLHLKKCTNGIIPQQFKSMLKDIPEGQKIGISLSGGVDSMITAWILSQICSKNELIAIHINYNNRDTCKEEVKFIRDWCCRIQMNLSVTNIIDLKRIVENNSIKCYFKEELISRNEYETRTKEIRFNAYKSEECIVVLGHNNDDLVENIITNISNNRKHNLMGMSYHSIIDNVTIFRPMIAITKKISTNMQKKLMFNFWTILLQNGAEEDV